MTTKTGGPAFPQSQTLTEREFISGLDVGEGGMTMRDYFAAKAMLNLSHVTVRKMIRAGTIRINQAGQIPISEIDRVLQPRAA